MIDLFLCPSPPVGPAPSKQLRIDSQKPRLAAQFLAVGLVHRRHYTVDIGVYNHAPLYNFL